MFLKIIWCKKTVKNYYFTAYESNLLSKGEENMEKKLDVFVSYRRSNGSQLASLLKVHLQVRGFTVFIDVERLEAGKFDNNLLRSIRQAKHFLLVLTPNALERCKQDTEQKDWVHRVSLNYTLFINEIFLRCLKWTFSVIYFYSTFKY